MAYTSPSPLPNAIWNGPNGSPIISPSQWQTQVVDNLAILAIHNHSGSAGEGASTLSANTGFGGGQRETITPFFPSACTSWVYASALTWPGGGHISTSTNGASISYDVYWGTGVHTAYVFYGKGSSFGRFTACLSGASVFSGTASYDGYKSGAEQPPSGASALTQVASFQFNIYTVAEFSASGSAVTGSLVGAGKYQLVIKVSGSNASSTGYISRLGSIQLI